MDTLMKNIVLVGFMGTGKTAVARELSKRLNMIYVSTDDLIKQREGMAINDIFAQKGEPYFRDVESAVAKEVSKESGAVIDAGGGIVLRDENISCLKAAGTLVCLSADAAKILERTKKYNHRPLLNVDDPRAKVGELLEKRAPFYAKVDFHIDTTNLSIKEVADKIIESTGMN